MLSVVNASTLSSNATNFIEALPDNAVLSQKVHNASLSVLSDPSGSLADITRFAAGGITGGACIAAVLAINAGKGFDKAMWEFAVKYCLHLLINPALP